jgi:2-furoyl-CoA dehydrogenase FAD binding subunit
MKPAAFDYQRVETAEEAIAALAECGEDGRILAGGQSLMAILNMRLAQPKRLIDISRSKAMAGVDVKGAMRIGAAATQASVEWRPDLAREVPLLALAFPHVSHFQIRNRGTVVGSIAHADPAAELPLCLLALEGTVQLRSAKRRRDVEADDFFTGMLSTSRAHDELVESVSFPTARTGAAYAFDEFSMRHGDFAVCAVAVVADAKRLRVAVGGVADRPMARDYDASLNASALDDALNEFAWSLGARDEPQACATMRRRLVRTLGRRAVDQALSRRSPS